MGSNDACAPDSHVSGDVFPIGTSSTEPGSLFFPLVEPPYVRKVPRSTETEGQDRDCCKAHEITIEVAGETVEVRSGPNTLEQGDAGPETSNSRQTSLTE